MKDMSAKKMLPGNRREKTAVSKDTPWWQRPMRMLTLWYGPGHGVSVRQFLDDMRWLHTNAIHGSTSDDPSSRKTLRQLHKAGIHVIYPVACSYGEAGTSLQEHPEWAQTAGDGSRMSFCCVNTPWREAFFRRLCDLLQRYEIDGIFLDGPFMAAEGCYCPSCLAGFQKRFGQEPPRSADWTSRIWKEFIRWKYDSVTGFLRDAKAAVASVRPDAPIYGNCAPTHRVSRESSRDPQEWARHVDILGSEAFMYYPSRFVERPLWAQSITAKYLVAAGRGKPAVVFTTFGVRPWFHRPLPPAMLRLTAAQTFANGASPWYECVLPRAPEAQALGNVFRFFARRERYFRGARSAANVAILWSRQAGDFYGLDPEESAAPIEDFVTGGEEALKRHGDPSRVHLSSLRGTCDALLRSHVPFDLILDQDLTDGARLDPYRVLVLPNAACLSQRQCETLRQFVASGGGLVATYQTSLFNEWGELLDDFGLHDVLGVRRTGVTQGPLDMKYISGPATPHPILSGVRWLLPSPDYILPVDVARTRRILLRLVAERFAYARSGPEFRGLKLSHPFLAAGPYREGRVVYFAGDPGDRYWEHPLPEIRGLLANAVRWASADTLPLTVDAPESVEAVLTRQQNPQRVIVHLINYTGEMANPISRILPVPNLGVRLRRKWVGGEIRGACRIGTGEALSWRTTREAVTFRLGVLEEYDALCVELR